MKDHEHAGFSWYLTEKKDVFNPYNLSDRISRKTWYENVTYRDMLREQKRKLVQKAIKSIEFKHIHSGNNALFTTFGCPECSEASQ